MQHSFFDFTNFILFLNFLSGYDRYERPGDFEYEDFFPLAVAPDGSYELEFEVKSASTAGICLRRSPDVYTNEGYELELGADCNSSYRLFKDKELVSDIEGVISDDVFVRFKIKISQGTVQVYRGTEEEALMQYDDPSAIDITCFSFQNTSPASSYRNFLPAETST